MNTSLTQSAIPVTMVQKAYSLNQIVEKMTSDYFQLLKTDSNPLVTLNTYITNGNDDSNSPFYGDYSSTTQYIQFDGNRNEIVDTSNNQRILKVVITKDNQSITILYTK